MAIDPLHHKEGDYLWRPFLAIYQSDEREFCLEIFALSHEHAELVLQDIRNTVRLEGEIVGEDDA